MFDNRAAVPAGVIIDEAAAPYGQADTGIFRGNRAAIFCAVLAECGVADNRLAAILQLDSAAVVMDSAFGQGQILDGEPAAVDGKDAELAIAADAVPIAFNCDRGW